MEENKNTKQNQNPLKASLVRNILLVLGLIAIVLVIMWFFNTGSRGTQTSYDDLVSKIESGSVTQIEFSNKYIIAKYSDNKLYWIYNSNGVNEVLIEQFTTNPNFHMENVKIITGDATTFNIFNILYPILMFVVLYKFLGGKDN